MSFVGQSGGENNNDKKKEENILLMLQVRGAGNTDEHHMGHNHIALCDKEGTTCGGTSLLGKKVKKLLFVV